MSLAGLASCGGSSSPDIDEGSANFEVQVERASFAARQHVAGDEDLVLAIKNASDREIPNVVVTIWTGSGDRGAAKAISSWDELRGSERSRPVWIRVAGFPKLLGAGVTERTLDAAPEGGADVAQTNTYAFGDLAAGASHTAVWRVTPVRAGSYTVHYAIAAGVGGAAKAVTAGGQPATGSFPVKIDATPRGICVVGAGEPGDCD
jgi:hypothetical protein